MRLGGQASLELTEGSPGGQHSVCTLACASNRTQKRGAGLISYLRETKCHTQASPILDFLLQRFPSRGGGRNVIHIEGSRQQRQK
jgi:hypothetical protein